LASSGDNSITFSSGLRALLPYARVGKWQYVASAALAVVGSLLQLAPFFIAYLVVTEVVEGAASEASLYRLAVIAVVCIVGMSLFLGASTWMSHRAAFATIEAVRLRIGERLGRVPLGFLTSRRSGEIQRSMSDEVERLEGFLAHAVPDLVVAMAVTVITTVWLFFVDWRMGLAAMAVVLISLPLMSIGMQRGAGKIAAYMDSQARMTGSMVEFIRGLPVIRMFNQTAEAFGETKEAIRSAARYESEWGREFLPVFTAFYTLLASTAVTLIPIGLWLWVSDGISAPDLLLFFIVGLGYSMPIIKLMEFSSILSRLSLAADMVGVLDSAPELAEVSSRADLGDPSVEFRDVSFSHPIDSEAGPRSRQVLADLSFHARPGTVTALVGPSGSGKTTLAKLIPRFWDVDEGAVLVGGVDVREIPFDQLMDQVAFVFQETFLFDDTVAGNLLMAKPGASLDEVVEACRAARAHEFVTALPQGYDTRLGERGARLSGGERQRLAIARAILKDAPIVILDEATAFADPENEAAIQDALSALIEGRTLIVIAHRLSTVTGADQILVLEAPPGEPGRIVERGAHEELLAGGGLYTRMWSAFQEAESITLGEAVRGSTGAEAPR
jgi:ATP-binding cassette, subfamily B, bacterial IrtA/YbtP